MIKWSRQELVSFHRGFRRLVIVVVTVPGPPEGPDTGERRFVKSEQPRRRYGVIYTLLNTTSIQKHHRKVEGIDHTHGETLSLTPERHSQCYGTCITEQMNGKVA